MAGRRECGSAAFVAGVLLLGALSVARAQEAYGPQEVEAAQATTTWPKCKGTNGQIIQRMPQMRDLPVERPPDWNYCNETCARVPINETVFHYPSCELHAWVYHKPIANITTDMMVWWFNGNVEGNMTHPVDGKVYPRYLVWHPRDHMYQRSVPKQSKNPPGSVDGAVWNIVEFMNAAARYTQSSENCAWKNEFYASDDLEVVHLDSTGLAMQLKIGLRNKPMRLNHYWNDTPEGLNLTSVIRIGFQGTNDAVLCRYTRRYALRAFGGNYPDTNAYNFQIHALQEFRNLRYFLPGLYSQFNP